MNVNEVIAAIANREHPGLAIHPNDDVNRGQSTNDTFPTVMHVYLARLTKEKLLPSVKLLRQAFERKADAYRDLVKIGRTHLMDATPLTVGQELSAFAAQLAQAERQLEQALDGIMDLAIGGTAVGTGINAHPEFGARVARALAHETGLPFRAAPNKFAMLAGHEAVLALSAAARTLAVACFKIASDIRLLASGPRCGVGEWILPANEPGSSIMPGKVNPTQCEAMTQVAAHVFGLDASVAFAATQGHLQLNVFKPLLVRNIGEALGLMADTCESFRAHCVEGMIPDQETIARHLERSLMLVTALTPLIGYEASARIAKTAHQSGMTLREAALASGQVTAEDFDRVVRADLMVGPR
jgi:fumarate hydratase class II